MNYKKKYKFIFKHIHRGDKKLFTKNYSHVAIHPARERAGILASE